MSEVLYSTRGYRMLNKLIDKITEAAKKTGQSQNKTHEQVVIKGLRYDDDMAAKNAEIAALKAEINKLTGN